jgi:hypothetical protein
MIITVEPFIKYGYDQENKYRMGAKKNYPKPNKTIKLFYWYSFWITFAHFIFYNCTFQPPRKAEAV